MVEAVRYTCTFTIKQEKLLFRSVDTHLDEATTVPICSSTSSLLTATYVALQILLQCYTRPDIMYPKLNARTLHTFDIINSCANTENQV